MQRLAVALLVALLCLGVALFVQMNSIAGKLEQREQQRLDFLEARVIVLEKSVERLKAKDELKEEN